MDAPKRPTERRGGVAAGVAALALFATCAVIGTQTSWSSSSSSLSAAAAPSLAARAIGIDDDGAQQGSQFNDDGAQGAFAGVSGDDVSAIGHARDDDPSGRFSNSSGSTASNRSASASNGTSSSNSSDVPDGLSGADDDGTFGGLTGVDDNPSDDGESGPGASGIDDMMGDDVKFDDDVTKDVDDANSVDVKDANAPFEVNIDLREFKEVDEFLKKNGIGVNSTTDEVLQWVPAGISVRMWPDRVQREIGVDAESGYVAFNIANFDDMGTYVYASYLIIMNLRGEVLTVKPIQKNTTTYGKMHFDALKLKDPRHLLLSANTDPLEESGPGYLYNWEDDEWIQLAAGESVSHMSHDIQWQERKKDDENDAIWRPTSSGFDLQDAKTGEYLETYVAPPSYLNDVNHAQILGYDGPYAILNSRVTNSFSKYDMRTGEIVWTCGGDRGGFDFVDIDGSTVAAGTSLFFGQHNLEYFGDNEYYMFDNNFNASTHDTFVNDAPSRLLIVRLDEDAMVATLQWELVLEDHTCVYGDNDRLPSGNVIGCSWPAIIDASSTMQYDARIFEVETSTKETAWEAFILGEQCDDPADGSAGCVRTYKGGYPNGWSMYSVERFYSAPLLYDVACAYAADGRLLLNATTHNNHKMNDVSPGSYRVYRHGDNGANDEPLKAGGFAFVPHWRPSVVTVDLSGTPFAVSSDDDGTLEGMISVTNTWGSKTAKHFVCPSS